MIYSIILVYLLFVIGIYIFIMKRLKSLSYRHMNNTGITTLGRGYEVIRRRVIVILILLFIVSSILILIFFHNDLFFKIGLHDNKEALNSVTF